MPETTAEAVRRLEAAGYAIVGKANLHEFAYGIDVGEPALRDGAEPGRAGAVAGGSSGGSAAALAAGLADAALGTDSGGSIRIPAACCGIVGFKPSYGLVPLDGCFPLAPSFDHAGPMARTVDGCAAMLDALVPGWEPRDADARATCASASPGSSGRPARPRPRRGRRVALPRRAPLELPAPRGRTTAFSHEVADVHRELFAEHAELYGENVRAKIERCLASRTRPPRPPPRARALPRAPRRASTTSTCS